jgi:hypothetical protein
MIATVSKNLSAIILLGLRFCPDDETETYSVLSLSRNGTALI